MVSPLMASLAALGLAVSVVPISAASVDVDLVLQGGTIHDGSGGEPVVGDVAVRAGRIVGVGKFTPGKVGRSIDCRGCIVAPGFIDLHTHTDGTLAQPGVRPCVNYLLQGCTTMGTGNCGGSRDVAAFLEDIDRNGAGVRYVFLAGQAAVDDSKPSPKMFGKALRHRSGNARLPGARPIRHRSRSRSRPRRSSAIFPATK